MLNRHFSDFVKRPISSHIHKSRVGTITTNLSESRSSNSFPLISVILPVYNCERWIGRAIESIVDQTYRNLELIVIDDGSTDGSGRLADSMQSNDSRIRVIHQSNQGIVAALNVGLSVARGSYIARMDADDVSVSLRLERQLKVMEAFPEITILGTKSRTISSGDNDDGSILENETTGPTKIIFKRSSVAQFPPSILQVLHPTIMMRTEDLRKIDGYSASYNHVEDYDLYLRASEIGLIAEVQEVLLLYRIHGGNVSILRLRQQEENAALCDLVNVQAIRHSHNLPELNISQSTMKGWVNFRIFRRERLLGSAHIKVMIIAIFFILKGSIKTDISITLKILARCFIYLLRYITEIKKSHPPYVE